MNRKKVFLLGIIVVALVASGVETWVLVDRYDAGGEPVITEITPKAIQPPFIPEYQINPDLQPLPTLTYIGVENAAS